MVKAHNFVVAYKEEEKRVVACAFIPLIEDPLAWEVQLAVESSKNQFACDAWNDWILDEKHENMNEFIHLSPKYSPRKDFVWATQVFLLTNHSLKNGVKYPQNIPQPCKHMKRFKGESGRHIE